MVVVGSQIGVWMAGGGGGDDGVPASEAVGRIG